MQALNTVTVKSRVDGNLVTVAFVEGQYVHQGDLLVQIDPRRYQTQLEQAEATKAKEQANLENARRDLARYAAIVNTQLAVLSPSAISSDSAGMAGQSPLRPGL